MIIHIAGPTIRVDNHLRQRCSWCGQIITDHDLTRTMIALNEDGEAPLPSGFGFEELIAHDGNSWYVVEHKDGDPLPPEACALMPVELTE